MGEWPRAAGLAEDVRSYGAWMREQAEQRIGDLYPKATLADGSKATVIAWIWARTVTCPNPACGIEMPLVRSWWLGKKKGKEAYVVPTVVDDAAAASGRKVRFTIGHDPNQAPTKENDGTVLRTGAVCVACGSAADLSYVRAEGCAGRVGEQLMAVVAEGNRRRIYVDPTQGHRNAAAIDRPVDLPDGELGNDPRAITAPNYGMTSFVDLFTNRQLTALTTFSDLVAEVRKEVRQIRVADVVVVRRIGRNERANGLHRCGIGLINLCGRTIARGRLDAISDPSDVRQEVPHRVREGVDLCVPRLAA